MLLLIDDEEFAGILCIVWLMLMKKIFPIINSQDFSRSLSVARLVPLLLLLISCSANRFEPNPGENYELGMLHRIEPKDTLASIAKFYRRDVGLLISLNGMRSPYRLQQGQYLYIPPDNSTSIVREGRMSLDSIYQARISIARQNREIHGRKKLPNKTAAVLKRSPSKGRFSRTTRIRNNKKDQSLKTAIASTNRKSRSKTSRRGKRKTSAVAPKPRRNKAFRWPLQGRYVRGFNTSNWKKPHKGIDIAAPHGTNIRSAQQGVVLFSGTMGTYGKMVVVDHGDGFSSLYAHCSKLVARKGQKVRAGQILAREGSTGRSTGPHLHMELRYNGVAVDPEKYFPKFGNDIQVARKGK